MNSRDKKKKAAADTPIADGDTRPDQLDETRIRKKMSEPEKSKEKKFSSSRAADINSLEDFKDEK